MSYHSYAQVYNNVTIYTPSNVAVGALQLVSGDLTSTQKTQSKNFWLSCYNNRISYISEATYSYNCHAYAWYTTEGGSNVWINDPEDDDFWGDFGYVEVVNQSSADKVSFGGPCYQYWTTCLGTSYTNPCDHSAITTTTTDYFISKWGAAPLFRHHKDDCPYSTQDIHYYAKLEISGPTILCSSGGSYTISNLPSGSTITWNNGSFVTRQSAQGSNPCTFVSSGHGSTWISATINFGGGGTITLPHFNVWSGIPALTSLSGPSPFYDEYGCTGQPYSFWTNPARDALSQSSYEWAVEPSYFSWYFQSQYNDWATVVFNDPNEYYQVRVRATNTCGASNWVSKMVSITDCYRFLLYPNPASGEVTISLTVAESVKKEEVPSNVLVRVTDNSGITYYSGTKGGDSFTIPVSNLKDGNYIVSIIYDGKIENLPLIIKN